MGEKGGSMQKGGICSPPFLDFLFSSSATASIKCFTSSSRSDFSELEQDLCLLFSRRTGVEMLALCNMAMQIENACRDENRAWKSTEYCPSPSAVIDREGSFSLLPCLKK